MILLPTTMDSWGFLHYFSLSMCSELYRCNLGVSLSLSLAPHFCIYACVFGYLFDPFIWRQIIFPSFRRGIKATRDHGYAVCSDFLWLADECDCVCVRLPQQNCGQKVWDAWNSWDSVLPVWPNTTSISALLISPSRKGRRTCKIFWEA